MSDERVCAFCWSVVRPASAVCPACGLTDAQAEAKLVSKPKRQPAPVAAEPERVGLANRPSDELAKLVVARSSAITWLTSLLGVVAFGAVFGSIGVLAGPAGAIALFVVGALAGFATGARAGQVLEAAVLLVARDALRRGTAMPGAESPDSRA